MQLVVVESPAKAKTIEGYLGKDYRVLASYGHVRDLPPKDGSVQPDDGFAMDWETYPDKAKQLKAITDLAKTADRLILATDPDREGEAISWHVREVLAKKKALPKEVERVTFNAITKASILDAMQHPRELDEDLIDAYRARRALDYLVGFTLSPVLWRKLPGAKSAGRVQSVALRLIVDREREIEAFRAQEYWSVTASLEQDGTAFDARLVRWKGDKIERLTIGAAGDANAAKAAVEAGRFTVSEVETKPLSRNPPAPFTTSTLQQEAARKLGFSATHTMRLAQGLYEDGAITYMRTDGVQMDGSAISAARGAIAKRYDASYVPDKPRQYTAKAKNAQEAHEAIRPVDFSKDRAGSGDHARLYELIWKRAMASQMQSARLERTSVTLEDATGQTALRATGQVVLFPGYLALYEEGRDEAAAGDDEGRLPRLSKGDAPAKKDVRAEQHFTQPPPRFSEASLVKRMEELGIGRPSTYAATLQTLKDREYVLLEKNRFSPSDSGRLVTAFLERFFERYVSYDYTASLEEGLDDVSGGREGWQALLEAFWKDFKPKTAEVMEAKPSEVTAALDEFLSPYLFPERADGGDPRLCPNCGNGRLSLRGGKFGAFIACSNYPDCKYTRQFGQPGDGGEKAEDAILGNDPVSGLPVESKSGRFGPYVQLGEGKEAKRSSIPKDAGPLDLELALKLLSLPREVGMHPESGLPITASIGRYGPYLLHDGKYARLQSTAEVFETGMNAAVVKLAEAAANGGRPARGSREPLKVLGKHPRTEAEVKVMEGRFGPYVTDGETNATLPKSIEPAALTLEEAVQLLDARAAAGPSKKKGKKAPAKKPAAKKAPAKKATAKKPDGTNQRNPRPAWMRIATYNVNGVNGRLPVLLRWLAETRPHVVCLQELKAPDEKFPEAAINEAGYEAIWHGQKSWNGVAMLSRIGTPQETRRGLPADPDDTHSRYIEAAVGGIIIGCLYLPNGNPRPGPKFDYKLRWFARFAEHAQGMLDTKLPVILAGDYNVMPTDLDVYKPERWLNDALFAPEVRAAFAELVGQGWTDALRHLHAGEVLYTFYDYFRNAYARNAGLRIDHLLLSPAVAPRLDSAGTDDHVRGWEKTSDHVPTWIELRD